MPYMRETITAGNVIELREYYTPRYNQKGGSRASHREETAEAQKIVNHRNAERKLRALLRMNFTTDDWFLTLRFQKGYCITHEEGRKAAKTFIRLLRREYQKNGLELRYIYAIEHKSRTCHLHFALPAVGQIAPSRVRQLWEVSHEKALSVYFRPMWSGDFATGMANYLLKEYDPKGEHCPKEGDPHPPKGASKFYCSRNLRQPEIVKEIMKRTKIPKEPFIKKGYVLLADTYYSGVCAFTGLEYRSYAMIRGDTPPNRKPSKPSKPKKKPLCRK
ncbi:MAG: hypothetical protein ACI3YH_03240 [Eubacteriales bacterium]